MATTTAARSLSSTTIVENSSGLIGADTIRSVFSSVLDAVDTVESRGALDPRQFGVIGDNPAVDDTVALQAAVNEAATTGIPLDFGRSMVVRTKGLVFPDTGSSYQYGDRILRIIGRGSTIRKISHTDNSYLACSNRWLNNVAFSQAPVCISDIIFDAAGIAADACVLTSFFSVIDRVIFRGATRHGLHVPGSTKNLTALQNGIANNEYRNIKAFDNAGSGVYIDGAGQITDWIFKDSFIYNNGPYNFYAGSAAGALISNLHLYHEASGVCNGGFFLGTSFGSSITSCIFEGDPGDPTKPCAVIQGNDPGAALTDCTFWSPVHCEFSASNKLITITASDFVESGSIRHRYNASDRIILSNGNTFKTASCYNWDPSSLVGRIVAANDLSVSSGLIHSGEQRPGGNVLGGYKAVDRQHATYMSPGTSFSVSTSSSSLFILSQPISALMTVFLPTEVSPGRTIRVVRTSSATGAFTLRVSSSGGTAMRDLSTVAQWGDFYYDGTSWTVTAGGNLF